jgi:hypothetical protein
MVKKSIVCAAVLAVAAAGAVQAQSWRDNLRSRLRQELASQEKLTVTGTLEVKDGTIALASGDTVYYVPNLRLLAGVVDGIKEGARVTVEGYLFQAPWLSVTRVTVGGKSYDISAPDIALPELPVLRGRAFMRPGTGSGLRGCW